MCKCWYARYSRNRVRTCWLRLSEMHSLGEKYLIFQSKSISTLFYMSHSIYVISNRSFNMTQMIWVILYDSVLEGCDLSRYLALEYFPEHSYDHSSTDDGFQSPCKRSKEVIQATDFCQIKPRALACDDDVLRIWHLEIFSMPDRTEFRTECLLWLSGRTIRKV